MRRLMTMTRTAGVLTVLVASTLSAQASARPAGIARLSVAPDAVRTTPVAQGGTSAPTTKWTIAGGIATGDSGYDLGFALQGSYKTTPVGWPVAIRIDPFLGRWTGGEDFGQFDYDFTVTMFGAQGSAVYDFPASGGMNWFVMGGLGIFYSSVSVDEDIIGVDASDSSTDLGIGIGGGLNFGRRFVIEAQFKSIGGFTTIPILFGIRL
jgi:hypothetical protein